MLGSRAVRVLTTAVKRHLPDYLEHLQLQPGSYLPSTQANMTPFNLRYSLLMAWVGGDCRWAERLVEDYGMKSKE